MWKRISLVAVTALVLTLAIDANLAQQPTVATTMQPTAEDSGSKLVNALAALFAALGSALAWYVGMKTKLGGGGQQSSITTTTTIDHQPSAAQQELYRLQRKLEEEQLKQDIREIIESVRTAIDHKIEQQDEGWKTLWISVRTDVHTMQTDMAVLKNAYEAVNREIAEMKRELMSRRTGR
jgi:hypothetical protein